jgi:hypothetical protein
MKTLITTLALATLIAVPALTQSAAAAPRARRDSDQSRQNYNESYHNGGYYNHNGTLYYRGYPLREWDRIQDRW